MDAGNIEVSIIANTDKVEPQLKKAIDDFGKVGDEAEKAGSKMDEAFNSAGSKASSLNRILEEEAKKIKEAGDNVTFMEESVKAASDDLSNGFIDAKEAIADMEQSVRAWSEQIDEGLSSAGGTCRELQSELEKLEYEYKEIGKEAGQAFMSGNDEEYTRLKERQTALQTEISQRRTAIKTLEESIGAVRREADETVASAQKQIEALRKVQKAADDKERKEAEAAKREQERAEAKEKREAKQAEAEQRRAERESSTQYQLRQTNRELGNVTAQLYEMEKAGQKNTPMYTQLCEKQRQLQEESGRLTTAMRHARKEASVLAHDNQGLQGVISAVSGVSGAFTAAQGVIALFGEKNEDLQKTMVKLQGLMSITMGLQQVANTLNRSSAASITILGGAEKFRNAVLKEVRLAIMGQYREQIKSTEATAADTVVTKGASKAKVAWTVATKGLTVAMKGLGSAIKKIPVIGWVLAGVSALIALVGKLREPMKKAKEESEEMTKTIGSGAADNIAKFMELKDKWESLGGSMSKQKKFIDENAASFNQLGVSVNSVNDAEDLFINNTENYIAAQKARAEADVYREKLRAKTAEYIEMEEKNKGNKNWNKKKTVYEKREYGTDMYGNKIWVDDTSQPIAEIYADKQRLKYEQMRKEADGYIAKIGELEQSVNDNLGKFKKATTTTTTKKDENEFETYLQKVKKQYDEFYKWQNSTDPIISGAATTQFASLLRGGNTYLEFLTGERDKLMQLEQQGKATATQLDNLKTINSEIANVANTTALDQFRTALAQQMDSAQTLFQMLDIIRRKREEVGDETTELAQQERAILDEAEQSINEATGQRLAEQVGQYSKYWIERLEFERNYAENHAIIQREIEEAEAAYKKALNEGNYELARQLRLRKEAAELALKGIERTHNDYQSDPTGTGVNYSKLLEEYKSFTQRKEAIEADFQNKIAVATANGNTELAKRLQEELAKELSKISLDEMMADPNWSKMFGNLDELATSEIQSIIEKIDGMTAYMGVQLNPEQLKVVQEALQKMRDEIVKRNPFSSLWDGYQKYAKAVKEGKDATGLLSKSIGESLQFIDGCFDAVVDGLKDMGVEMDEETQKVLDDVGGILEGAGNVAMGIASGNPLQIIQGTISLITSAIDLCKAKAREVSRNVRESEQKVDDLQYKYDRLAKQAEKAVGEGLDEVNRQMMKNLQLQRAELEYQLRQKESLSDKDRDKDEEEALRQQIDGINDAMEDLLDSMKEAIMGSDIKSLAEDLANSLVDAWAAGENAVAAYENSVKDMVKNMVRNILIQKMLVEPINDMIEDWFGNTNENTTTEDWKDRIRGFYDAAMDKGQEYVDIINGLDQDLKDILSGPDAGTLSGAIAGASQESIDLLAGQTNAIRAQQVVTNDLMREQLLHIANIDTNVSSMRTSLEDIERRMRGVTTADRERAMGNS